MYIAVHSIYTHPAELLSEPSSSNKTKTTQCLHNPCIVSEKPMKMYDTTLMVCLPSGLNSLPTVKTCETVLTKNNGNKQSHEHDEAKQNLNLKEIKYV